ncbi:MAG TPA: hypothetical protein VEL76_19970 [Gemmataceae bacterium]|nr:hypothetical protein [Gemmataceae bacterium]
MGTRQRGELPKDLAQGRHQFQAWRERRQGTRRIPQPLWDLAVRLVSQHGLSRTATALGLDYYSLKKRVEAAGQEPPSPGPAFVELPAPLVVSKQALFELDNGAGATMRVQLLGYDAADVEVLARRFWGAE